MARPGPYAKARSAFPDCGPEPRERLAQALIGHISKCRGDPCLLFGIGLCRGTDRPPGQRRPGDLGPTYVLIAILCAAAVWALVAAWRRGAWELLLWLAVTQVRAKE